MYYVYVLRCADHSLYVGYTRHIERRVEAHNAGTGARHTSERRPVRLVYSESHASRAAAVARERQLKGWTWAKKEALIHGHFDRLHELSRRRRR